MRMELPQLGPQMRLGRSIREPFMEWVFFSLPWEIRAGVNPIAWRMLEPSLRVSLRQPLWQALRRP